MFLLTKKLNIFEKNKQIKTHKRVKFKKNYNKNLRELRFNCSKKYKYS